MAIISELHGIGLTCVNELAAKPLHRRASSIACRSGAGEIAMSITGLDVFDRTLHETNSWLKELMATLPTEDRRVAYLALRAALHVLRDRIGPENATHLGA
jgi:hypothetical protein